MKGRSYKGYYIEFRPRDWGYYLVIWRGVQAVQQIFVKWSDRRKGQAEAWIDAQTAEVMA